MKVLGFITAFVVGGIWNAFGLTVLWRWFMIPIFGLPALNIAGAWGILMIAGYLTYHPEFKKENEEALYQLMATLVWLCVCPVIAIGIGWILKYWL